MRKRRLTKKISLLILSCLFSVSSVFAFDWSVYQNDNYIMVEDDMDDSVLVWWKEKDTAYKFTLLDNNNNIDNISLSIVTGMDVNKTSVLALNLFCFGSINANKIIIMTDAHRYTFDLKNSIDIINNGNVSYERYTINIVDSDGIKLLEEMRTDTKPEKVRIIGDITVNAKINFSSDLRDGFYRMAEDYVNAEGFDQDLSYIYNRLIEVKEVEPWEWEDHTPTPKPTATPTPTPTPTPNHSTGSSPKTYGYQKDDKYAREQDKDGDGLITDEEFGVALGNAINDAMNEYGVDSFDALMEAMANDN